MSVVVAVVSQAGAALATDSIRVDLPAGTWTSGNVKHVGVGYRAGAFVGLADHGDGAVNEWLRAALDEAPSLDDVPARFLDAAGQSLPLAYAHWRALVGPDPAPEEFLELVVITTENGYPEVLNVYAALAGPSSAPLITLVGSVERAGAAAAKVVAAGAVDPTLLAATSNGRVLREAELLQRGAASIPDSPHLPADLTVDECERHAIALVDQRLRREATGVWTPATPAYWPLGVPTAVGPTHAARASGSTG